MGVAKGAFCPTSFASTAEASRPSRRGFNQGLRQSAFALLGLGPILATHMLAMFSWRIMFLLVAMPGLVLTVLLYTIIRKPAPLSATPSAAKPTDEPGSVATLFAHRNVALATVGLLCPICGIFVLSANIPIYLTQRIGLSPTDMGW